MTRPTPEQVRCARFDALSPVSLHLGAAKVLVAEIDALKEEVIGAEYDAGLIRAELDEAKTAAWYAFIAGAKWWEYESRGATMWQSDQDRAQAEAERRYPYAPHPVVRVAEIRAEQAETACAAMRTAIEAVVSAGCTSAAFRRHCIPALALVQHGDDDAA